MSRTLAFILGMIFGIIFFLASLGIAGYLAVAYFTPNDFLGENSDFLGDLANMSIYNIILELMDMLNDASLNIFEPDGNGRYFSLGDFIDKYNLNLTSILPFELSDDLLEIPLFTFFADDGITKVLGQTPATAVLELVGLLSENAITKLRTAGCSILDLINDPFQALAVLDVGDVMQDWVNSDSAIFSSLAACSLGGMIDAFMGGNIFGEFQTGGALEALGSLELSSLFGEGDSLGNIFSGVVLADLFDSSGGISVDGIFDDMYLLSFLGYSLNDQDEWIDSNGDPVSGLYAAFADLSVGKLMGGEFEFDSLMEDISIGDVMDPNSLPSFLQGIAGVPIGELTESFDSIQLGSVLGFERDEIADIDLDEISNYIVTDNDNNPLVVLVPPVTQPMSTARTSTDKYAMYDTLSKKWYNAELVCDDDTCSHTTIDCFRFVWSSSDGSDIDPLMKIFADKSIGMLTSGDFDVTTLLDDITLGSVLTNIPSFLEPFKDKPISQLSTSFDDIMLGDFLGLSLKEADEHATFTKELDGKLYYAKYKCNSADDEQHQHNDTCETAFIWFEKNSDGTLGDEADQMMSIFAGKTVSELSNFSVDELIGDFTLEDVLGDNIPEMLEALKDKPISELSDALEEMYLGDFLGLSLKKADGSEAYKKELDGEFYYAKLDCDIEHDTHDNTCDTIFIWFEKPDNGDPTKEAEKLINIFANKKVSELSDGFKVDDLLGDMTLFDVLGDDVPEMLESLKDKPISELTTALEEMYLGDFLGLSLKKADGSETYKKELDGEFYYAKLDCDIEHDTHNDTCDTIFIWFEKDDNGIPTKEAEKLINIFANKKVSELSDGFKVDDLIGDMTLFDVLGDDVPEMLESLKDKPISDLTDALDSMYVGELIGLGLNPDEGGKEYTDGKNYEAEWSCGNPDEDHEHDENCTQNFVWYEKDKNGTITVKAEKLMSIFANKTVAELNSGFDTEELLNDLTLGEVMGDELTGFLKVLEDTKVLELSDALKTIYIGDVMEYHRNALIGSPNPADKLVESGGKWYKEDDGTWYEAKLVCDCVGNDNHTVNCADILWFDDKNAEVTGINAALVNLKIDDLSNSQTMTDSINKLTLSDVLDGELTGILEILKDKPIGELSTALSDVYIGDVMEYNRKEFTGTLGDNPDVVFKDTDKWYKEDNGVWYEAKFVCDDTVHAHTASCTEILWFDSTDTEVTGVNAALVNLKIDDLSKGDTLENTINGLTLGDVLGDNLSGILASLSDTEIGKLSTAISDIYIGDVMNYTRMPIAEDGYGETAIAGVKSNPSGNFIKKGTDGVWYEATFDCDESHSHDENCYGFVWYEKDSTSGEATGNPIDGINAALVNLKIDDLTEGNALKDSINKLTLGDVLGTEGLTGILASLSDTKIGDMSDAIDKIYIGEVMEYTRKPVDDDSGYTVVADSIKSDGNGNYIKKGTDGIWYEAKFVCDDTVHTHTAACAEILWFDDTAEVKGVNAALVNLTISELSDSQTMTNSINSLTLGDVLGNGLTGILASLSDTKIGDMSTAIDKIYIGEVMDYTRKPIAEDGYAETGITGIKSKDSSFIKKGTDGIWYEATFDCDDESHQHDEDCYGFVWYTKGSDGKPTGDPIDGVNAALVNLTINDLSSENALKDSINSLTLGDVLGNDLTGILASLSDTKIGDMSDAIDSIFIGEVMNYTRKSVDESNYGTEIVADSIMSDENGNYIKKGTDGVWYEAKLVCDCVDDNHNDACAEILWFDGTDEVTGINAALVNLTISDLSDENAMQNSIQNLKLGDVVDTNGSDILTALKDTKISNMGDAIGKLKLSDIVKPGDSTILQLLADEPINNIGTAINDLTLGGIMGYTEDGNGGWLDSKNAPVTGIGAAIADMKIGDIDADALKDRILDLPIGDLIEPGNSKLLVALKDTKLSEMSTALDDMYVGIMLGLYRKELTPTVTDNSVKIFFDGSQWYKKDGDKWYEAKLACEETATHLNDSAHDEDCVEFVWYNDEDWATPSNALNGKIANLAISEMTPAALTGIVSSLTVGDMMDAGILILESSAETTLNALFAEEGRFYAQYQAYLLAQATVLPPSTPLSLTAYYLQERSQYVDADKAVWQSLKLSEFLSTLLDTIN